MDIYNLIDNAQYNAKCNSTFENKYIMALEKIDFYDVYSELKFRDNFLVVDKKENINLFIRLKDTTIIADLSESKKNYIYAKWNCYGPEIIFKIQGIEEIPGFIMELENSKDVFILQKLLRNGEVFIQYIIEDEKGIIKLLTKKIQIDSNFIERLKYYIELDFYGEYPKITEKEIYKENGYYINTRVEINVLEEVLNITDKLKALNIDEQILVHVQINNFYKIIFSGDKQIIKKIVDELSNRIKIFEEGTTGVSGTPFFKYSNGLLYFYEKTIFNIGGM